VTTCLLEQLRLRRPEQLDDLLDWSPGTCARLARRGRLPHYRLPGGEIRLNVDEVLEMVRRVPVTAISKQSTG